LVFVAAVDAFALIVAQELERDALAAVATPLLVEIEKKFIFKITEKTDPNKYKNKQGR
jgi:hypothetical protein